ncbi:MAG: nickel-type superoxide dismutase maturation protease [Chloroflexi bacterium]|nr:nickel-type superoxide dismutase maturation protease [Chloroflexota bacterium]
MLRRLRALLPFDRFIVEGESMAPSVSPGERVFVIKAAYWFGKPMPGDLVVLRDPRKPERLLIKRIDEAHGNSFEVAGDNVDASTDSRTFGPVPASLILGKVWFRY